MKFTSFITLSALAFGTLSSLSAVAAIQEKNLEYQFEGKTYEAYIAFEDTLSSLRPGILIIHNWMGLGEGSKESARELAKLGYVGMAADVYGKGVRPKDATEASKLAGDLKSDRQTLRKRSEAALKFLKKQIDVDSRRLAAIGYCFGGTSVLEMARDKQDVKAVVSFHGGLDKNETVKNASQFKSKILVLHGADDPYVPAEQVASFEAEMKKAKADWQLVAYGNSVHSFTDKSAGNDNSKGAAYNELAAKRSWQAMKTFFEETL